MAQTICPTGLGAQDVLVRPSYRLIESRAIQEENPDYAKRTSRIPQDEMARKIKELEVQIK
ncbi:MAG: hypothetical protein JEZ06_20370 [Anaerolineaceae bacterium]|nr:hypothetical protein [Anaerolineaceae bacterium]